MTVVSKYILSESDISSAERLGKKSVLEIVTAGLIKDVVDFMKTHDMGSAELITENEEKEDLFKAGTELRIKLDIKLQKKRR